MNASDAASISVAKTELTSAPVESISQAGASIEVSPLRCATGVYVTVHGHFYQPPRENPYLGTIERQRSANPFHDWNERIHHECYRPNAFARILNNQGEITGIVNNYEYLSFNIGPTLMNWLERHDVEVYQCILEADRKSCDRLNGHGNAIAQVYNHIILPLANQRDKYTQIRWGKADFRSRFGRDPEGMWLAETAVDAATLEALVAEGIRFIVLAPSQAQRCRPIPSGDQAATQWYEVGGGQIDPTRPYRCFLPGSASEGSSRPYIDIFFYDGPISGDMGFGETLSSSQYFAGRIGQAVRGDRKLAQLIAVATDGETFGHHKTGTERALAYALIEEFPRRGWTVTNFAHYLSLNPPTWEVELKPVTAWSCAHGVDRWQDNCGCGGGGVWHQKWRRPLRDTLNWLRDQLSQVYAETGERLFKAPWQARDEYIEVIREQIPTFLESNQTSNPLDRFLARHQTHPLTEIERVDALRLLEMQRYALLMFTSCGWFFEELSRPEGVQILRYAARALELAGDVAGVQLEAEFIQRLAQAPSNIDWFKDGAEVYHQLVAPAKISLHQVAAHYAISSLFTPYPQQHQIYCYIAHQLDYQLQRMGSLTLAVGQLQLVSEITHETVHLIFGVLHLGGWDFHCCIQPFSGREQYSQIKANLLEALQQASAAQTILAMTQGFGSESYGLHNLFAEERHRIMCLLTQETSTRLDQLYTQVYRDNYGVLMAFQRDELSPPQELKVAAEVALSHRITVSLKGLEQEISDPANPNSQLGFSYIAELEAIATEASYLGCQLNLTEARKTLERLILRLLWQLLHDVKPATVEIDLQRLEDLIDLGQRLHLNLTLDQAQELYFHCLHESIGSQCLRWLQHQSVSVDRPLEESTAAPTELTHQPEPILQLPQLRRLLQLGQTLAVDVSYWLNQLSQAVPCSDSAVSLTSNQSQPI